MQLTLPAIAINGELNKQVSPLDRGFAYGDGVFESCRIIQAKIPLWKLHAQRLIASCETLLIPISISVVNDYLAQLMRLISEHDLEDAIVKIIVTRGTGGRGYRLPDQINPTICIGIFPAILYPESYSSAGVSVRICSLRLGCNPVLAGLKHLNRLEHILARAEWNDEEFAEGLLFDTNNNLIEATVSNVFIVQNGELFTPEVIDAGVAGVMRRLVIEELAVQIGLEVCVKKLSREDLWSANEIFLCNSVFGIWPVINVFDQRNYFFARGSKTLLLQRLLAARLLAS